jgi:hypothetical protein
MTANPDVEAWFEALEHPLKDAMLRVRSTILGVDDRIEEALKWKSPTFMFHGNIASIDPRAKRHVSLMFHQGASLPGRHPMFEGGGGTVRYLRFANVDDVSRKEQAIKAAIRAWVKLRSG